MSYDFKILVCTQMFPASEDGALISGMIKNPYYQTLAVAKHVSKVDVVTTGENTFSRNVRNVSVFSVGNGWLKGIFKSFIFETKIALKCMSLMRKNDYDLLHIHHLNIPILVLLKKVGLIKIKFIYTAHGTSTPELNAARQGSWLNHFLLKANGFVQHWLDGVCWRNSDYLLSPSKYQISEMKELYGVDKTPIEVVYNGYEESLYRPIDPKLLTIRKELSIKDEDKLVLFVGRAAKKKGIDILIKAMDSVVEKFPSSKMLLVVGYMGRQKKYRDEIKLQAGLRDYIAYKESIPESLMGEIYNSADLCVFPSIGYESIPTVIYEAMACGKPIVTQGSWGVPEVLSDFYIDESEIMGGDLANKILNVINDEDGLQSSIKNNLEACSQYSWENGGVILSDIYSKVIASD